MTWASPARNGRDITTEINTGDGRGWRTVAANGTESYSVGYSTTRTLSVRTSAAGQTTTASASATSAAPPPPRVWVSRGDFENVGCDFGCYRYVVNTQNFPAGNYQIDCWNDGGGSAGKFGTRYSFNLPANGSVQLYCWSGAEGYNVWVDIIGWGGSVDTEKQWWPRN